MRLARAFARATEPDPIFPLVLHTLERGLEREARGGSTQTATIFDRVFDRALRRHPRVDRQKLRQLVKDSRSLSDELVGRVVPQTLMHLSPGEAIGLGDARLASLIDFDPAALLSRHTLKVIEGMTEADLQRPRIKKLLPKRTSYEPGESINLIGSNLNPQKAKITVQLASGNVDHPGADERLIPLSPAKNTASPWFVLPDDLHLGKVYDLRVIREVGGKTYESNVVLVPIIAPQPLPEVPQPTLTELTPQRRPGDKMIVTGSDFLGIPAFELGDRTRVLIEPMDVDGTAPSTIVPTKLLGPTQLELELPLHITPGLYRFAVCNIGDGQQFSGIKTSEWVNYQILPHSFQVTFLTMHCIDESDPETFLGVEVHDTLVTTWAVGTDALRIVKSSKDYEGFDDNDVQAYAPEDRAVFAGEVKHGLVLATQLYEWDAGDVKSVNEVIQVVGDIAGEIGKLLATKKPTVAAILMGLEIASTFLQKVMAYFAGSASFLGERGLAFPIGELQQKTQNAGKKLAGELPFLNDDDTGSYKLAYEVVRLT